MPDSRGKPSLLIVQPYVPRYRQTFFEGLISQLSAEGIACRVAAASPSGAQQRRGDSVSASWIVEYTPKRFNVGGRTIGLGGARPLWKDDDAVIVGHLGSSLDTYLALLDAARHGTKAGVWGHIKPYVSDGNAIDLALERWQLRHSDQIFAYTPGGRDYAVTAGADPSKVTTVMNATDTSVLHNAKKATSAEKIKSFMALHHLKKERTLGYIGGLDASKRIDFLVATLDRLWVTDPDIRILVGGKGSDSYLLNSACRRGQAIMLGYASADEQVLIAESSSALVMPGRIGLVAVDALVLGIPILTTNWPYHAPENEYLIESSSRFTASNTVDSYAQLIREFLHRDAVTGRPRPTLQNQIPTIEAMVDNFSSGVLRMFGSRSS